MKNDFTAYDTEEISKIINKRFLGTVLKTAVLVLLFVISVVAIIIYGTYLAVFIAALIIVIAASLLLGKTIKGMRFGAPRYSLGKIENVHVEIKNIRTHPVATFGLFRRKYDMDWKDEIRLSVYIKNGEDIHAYHLNGISQKQADYYKEGEEAMHIPLTRFPIYNNSERKNWLCPICGTFNENSVSYCENCKCKALK